MEKKGEMKMCGRFTLLTPWEELLRTYDAVSEMEELEPSYNIAPTQQIVAVIHDGNKRRLGTLRWGLIPPWAPDKKIGSKMINARAETLVEKRSFKKAFQKQRCLIPADSFYEWKTEDGKKQPMRIQRKDKTPLTFAGLWEKWQDEDGSKISPAPSSQPKPTASCSRFITECRLYSHLLLRTSGSIGNSKSQINCSHC